MNATKREKTLVLPDNKEEQTTNCVKKGMFAALYTAKKNK